VQEFTVEKVIEAWKSRFDDDPQSKYSLLNESYSLTLVLLKLLAEGHPVSAEQLAECSDLSMDQIDPIFKRFKDCGGEFDDQGNVVGAALTQNPTPHRFLVNSKQLYTWCALDALFLLGRTAEVASTCPVSGQIIQLSINPGGVAKHSHSGMVLSITIPGLSCETGCCCHANKTGPRSDACSQMHFFSSRGAAQEWLRNRPGIAILTVDEAWRLAKAIWIDHRI